MYFSLSRTLFKLNVICILPTIVKEQYGCKKRSYLTSLSIIGARFCSKTVSINALLTLALPSQAAFRLSFTPYEKHERKLTI